MQMAAKAGPGYTVADFNGDGKLDLAIINLGCYAEERSLAKGFQDFALRAW